MDTPDAVLAKLSAKQRLHGAIMLFGGTLMFALGITAIATSVYPDKATIAVFVAAGIAAVGAWKLVRRPPYLRQPDRIERVDAFAPGDRYALQVVMEDGRVCKVSVAASEREALVAALEFARNAKRVQARVVRR